jgi:hypothetical protein
MNNQGQEAQFVNFTTYLGAAQLDAKDGNHAQALPPRLAPSESFDGDADDNISMAVELSSVESGAVSNFRDFDLRDSSAGGSVKSVKRRLSGDMSISNTPREATAAISLPNRLPLFSAPPPPPSPSIDFPPVETQMNSEQLEMLSPLSASVSWRGSSQPQQLEAPTPSAPTASLVENSTTTFATLADAPAEWWKERASHHFNRALHLQQFPPRRWASADAGHSAHSDSGSSRSTSIATSLRVEIDSFYDDDGVGSTSDAAAAATAAAAVSAAQYQDRMFASSVDNLSLIDARSDTQALSDDDGDDDSDLSSGDDDDDNDDNDDDNDDGRSEGNDTAGRSGVSNISDRRTMTHETTVSGHKHGRSRSLASSVMSTSPSMDSHLSDMQSYDSRHRYARPGIPPRLAPPSTSPSIASVLHGDDSCEPMKKLRRKLTSTPSDDASSTAAVVLNPAVMVDVSPLSTSPSWSMRAPLHGQRQEYRAVSLAELPSMLGKHGRSSQGGNSNNNSNSDEYGGPLLVSMADFDRHESEAMWAAKRQRLPTNATPATDYSTAIQQSLARRQAMEEDALDGDSSLIRKRRSRLFQRRRLWKQHQAAQQQQSLR